ncbi:MAG TPA: hypothetical protein VGC85_11605 [Chthoniobacterales bacterium]
MEQIVFVILVAAVALLRFAMQAAEKKRNAEAARGGAAKPQQANAPVQRAPSETEEERVRRLMEALGMPTNTPPPREPRRVIVPKTERAPRRKIMPVDPFPAGRTGVPPNPVASLPPVVVAAPVLSPPRAITTPAQTSVTAAPTAQVFEVHDLNWPSEGATSPPTSTRSALVTQDVFPAPQSWATRLATPESLRDAVVIREIFGPPRSLQPALPDSFSAFLIGN